METELVGYLSGVHGVRKILLVSKYQKYSVPKLILNQHCSVSESRLNFTRKKSQSFLNQIPRSTFCATRPWLRPHGPCRCCRQQRSTPVCSESNVSTKDGSAIVIQTQQFYIFTHHIFSTPIKYLVLTPDIPDSEANVLVFHSLHIKP